MIKKQPIFYKFFKLMVMIIIFSLLGAEAFAVSNMDMQGDSLEWQLINLRERVRNQVKDSLTPLISSEKYIVEVKIEIDPSKAPAISSKSQGEKKPKEKVKLSDVKLGEQPEDFVVFSKLGLEAPVYGIQEEVEKTSDAELMQRSVIELKEKYNLFRYLKSVDIKVFLSEKLSDQTRTAIKSVTDNLSFSLGVIVPTISVDYINLSEELIPEPKIMTAEDKLNNYLTWVSKFSNTIGMIVAALFLGLIAFLLFRRYEKLHKEEMELMEEGLSKDKGINAAQQAQAPVAGKVESSEHPKTEEGDVLTQPQSGIDRFVKFLSNNKVEAVLMVKRWIKDSSVETQNALRYLVYHLDNEDLLKIFSGLASQERGEWKKLLSYRPTEAEMDSSGQFISQQIVDDILVPSMIDDPEVADLILSVSPEACANISSTNLSLGEIFMNVMSTKFLSQMMNLMEEDQVRELIERSAQFRKEQLKGKLVELKQTLKKAIEKVEHSPFLDRVLDLIPLASPLSERPLFLALAKRGEANILLSAAKNYYPSELMSSLPEIVKKQIFQQMSLETRTEFFASLASEMREEYLNVFALEGSKARDLMSMELEKFAEEPELQEKVNSKADEIWKSYVDLSRSLIRSNPQLAQALSEILNEWTDGLLEEAGVESNKERRNLKLVA